MSELEHTGPAAYGPRRAAPLPKIWPFTTPLADLRLVLLLLPLLWALGLEQILPPVLLAFAFGKLLLLKRRLRIPFALTLFLLFLVWQFVSATSIDISSNWILFGRNFISYLTGWIIAVVIINGVRHSSDLAALIRALLWLALLASLIGVVFAAGLLPNRFEALLVPDLLPGSIKQSQFVQESIIQRMVINPEAQLGGITYPRVSSIFLFPTGAASGFLLMLCILHLRVQMSRRRRLFWLGVLLLAFVIFLLTAARLAIIALLFVIGIRIYLSWRKRYKLPRWFWLLFTLLAAFPILILILTPNSPLFAAIDAMFVATRADSFTNRLEVYIATLTSWQERPLIGWGTPRVISTVKLAPAGTHGEYLSILYNFGFIGFLLYLTFWGSVWLQLGQRLRYTWHNKRSPILLFYLTIATGLLGINLNGMANGMHFDMVVIILLWTFIGLAHLPAQFIANLNKNSLARDAPR
jgi:O-antigen ligase